VRLTLKTVNRELAKLGYSARLEKGDGYFYFHFGEAVDWLDRTVRVRNLNSLTLKQWITEFHRLKTLNEQIMPTVQPGHSAVGAAGAANAPPGRKRRSSRSR
jgi:hypothetical protein